jgi:hypothetical protein
MNVMKTWRRVPVDNRRRKLTSSHPRRAANNGIAHLFTPPTTLDDKEDMGMR